MKSTISILSALLLTTLASAQYTTQSKPFQLVIISSNATLNGSIFDSCHEGAAIEGLCVVPDTESGEYTTYHLNTSASQTTPLPAAGKSGILTWELESNINGTYLSSTSCLMALSRSDSKC